MSAGDSLNNFSEQVDPGYVYPPDVTGGLTDVGYDGGLSDSVFSYSGSSTLQDVTVGSSSLALSTESGYNEDSSVYDFIDGQDPASAQQLSGVSDPPFASAAVSSPTPNSSPFSNPLAFAQGALSKLGSSFAALFGNHTVTTQPGIVPATGPGGAVTVPATAVTGQTTILLVMVAGAVILLLLASRE